MPAIELNSRLVCSVAVPLLYMLHQVCNVYATAAAARYDDLQLVGSKNKAAWIDYWRNSSSERSCKFGGVAEQCVTGAPQYVVINILLTHSSLASSLYQLNLWKSQWI